MEYSNNQINNSNIKRNKPHNNSVNRQPINRMPGQKQRIEDNILKITAEVYNCKSKGDLVLDLKTGELIWTLKDNRTEDFNKRFTTQGHEKISILKSNIKKITNINSPDGRYLLRVELKNPINLISYLIFSFQDNNKEILRDKFYNLLSYDYFNYYKTEFQMLPIEQQKRICLLLNNKYLILLYKKLIVGSRDIDLAWKFIKYKYPEAININLGQNRIQLSRDEELIMLSQKKYDITKLINSDSKIYNAYKERNNIKNDNFWSDFIERQKNHNTYIVGGYKPANIGKEDKNKEEITINNIFENLEKDKYYYDCYETNYLYHNDAMKKDLENLRDKIKLLNDYSMNKMKDINYFSYSSLCLNAYNNKRSNKNKIYKKCSSLNTSNSNEIISNINNRLTKEELLNRIKNMEIEYDNEKEDNSCYNTMKAINDENFNMYNFSKFEPNKLPLENNISNYLNYIFLMKDISLYKKYDYHQNLEKIQKQDGKLSPQKRDDERAIKIKLEYYNREIKILFENLKKKINQKNDWSSFEPILNFLIRMGEKTIDELNTSNKRNKNYFI